MRKFKIKNRRKRKYVKKNQWSNSLAHTQSITVGIIPAVLMAVAFFTTLLIANPPETTYIPSFSMPHAAIPAPELPNWEITISAPSIPVVQLPALPAIILPDIEPYMISSYSLATNTVNSFLQSAYYAFEAFGTFLITSFILTWHTAVLSLQQAGSAVESTWTATGHSMIAGTAALWDTTTTTARALYTAFLISMQVSGDALTAFSLTVQYNAVQAVTVLSFWLETAMTVLVKALSDFIWFLGTPFRALFAALDNLILFLTPFYNFLINSLEHALHDLAAGGEALRQGTVYISDSVSTSQ